jgi:hypothetical protein
MNSQFNFVVDSTIKGRIYPALARHQGRPYTQSWREFGQHWPYTTPLRLEEYCREHSIVINNYAVDTDCPDNSYYPICLGFFDFEIDYFELMSPEVRKKLRQDKLRVLFMYHEGDNPRRIKNRLDSLAENHLLPPDCYVFISANTAADQLPGFVTFHDFELWYYQRNLTSTPYMIHREPRQRDFTCLSRLHKWWRATAMADLHRTGLLSNSYWSYCESGQLVDADNPIEIDALDGLRESTEQFLKSAPYYSDELDQEARNNHAHLVGKYFSNSYCHIVMETHWDADQSGGAFLTEKTFKPIKHGQMFFVAGPAGSLQTLRDLGYRTFDGILDTSYDYDSNNTHRWIKLRNAIVKAQADLPRLFERARSDIEHNQRLFLETKTARLNILLGHINESY